MACAITASAACGDLPRSNPYDPSGVLQIVLTGPDSVTAVGDTVTFEVRSTTGESLDQLATFTTPPFLSETGRRGQFVAVAAGTLARVEGTITAHVNANAAAKSFVFSQQPSSLTVDDCAASKVMSFTALGIADHPFVYGELICAHLLDRRGFPLPVLLADAWRSRNESVVKVAIESQAVLNATGVGSTYVVFTYGTFRDSLRADVRQEVAQFGVGPSECRSGGATLRTGETIQLAVLAPGLDSHGNQVTDAATVQAALSAVYWLFEDRLKVTISRSGFVTALSPSDGYAYAILDKGDEQAIVAGCLIHVI